MCLTLSAAAQETDNSIRPEDGIVQTLDQQALPDLIATLTDKGKTPHFRMMHVQGGLQDPRANTYLIQAYEESDSEGVRCKLLESMGKLRDPALMPWFIQRLKDPHIAIQCFAIWALGELKNAAAAPLLLQKLWSANRFVELTAIDALGKMGQNPRIATALELFLRDDDVEVRYLTAKAFAGVGAEDSAPELFERLRQEPSLDVQEALAKAVGRVGGGLAVGHLIELLKNPPSQTTDHWVVIGLTSADPHLVIPALTPLSESPDLRLRVAATQILNVIDSQSRGSKP